MSQSVKQFLITKGINFFKATGIVTNRCVFCDSSNIKLYPRVWINLPFEIPKDAKRYEDQLRIRDNGICLDCGLEQSFYKFSEAGRQLFYQLGLDTLSAGSQFDRYPPSQQWMQKVYEAWYGKRILKWDKYLQSRGVRKLEKVLHLRFIYGQVLQHFEKNYHAKLWGMEMVHTCERYARENLPNINLLDGNLSAAIEVSPSIQVKFDLIICSHTLSHSLSITRDLKILGSLLSKNGMIIFCDEISKKLNNPFHMVHPDEKIFVNILSKFFGEIDRIDDCGSPVPHVVPYTLKGDNPDIVVGNFLL